VAKWLRYTYQAPFRDPPGAQNVKTLERYRRSSLLRIITFNITLTLLIVSAFSWIFIHAQFNITELIALFILSVAGVVSLTYNEFGKITVAGAIYLYGFFLAIYVYIIFSPYGLDATVLSIYGLINALMFMGGLICSQKALLPHCGLIILITSLILLLTPPGHAATTTSIPVLIGFFDFGYLLTTFLCWLAGRSGRVGMMKLATILEQEKQLNILKDLFIVSANHELRTPIMTMSNNLELASRTLDRVDHEQRQEMLARALRASQDLKDILQCAGCRHQRSGNHQAAADRRFERAHGSSASVGYL